MIILEHSIFDERTIARNLGASEYSYWFVRKAFRPVLQSLGVLIPISEPERDVDRIYEAARRDGQDCVFLSFSAPQYTPIDLACPTIPIYAWEFDTIPDESWNANPLEDWRKVFAHTGLAITHSAFSVAATKRTMGPDFPIWSIPAPVYNRAAALGGDAVGRRDRFELDVTGAIVVDVGRTDLSLFTADRVNTDGARALLMARKEASTAKAKRQAIPVEGVIYTAVLNTADGRKNWEDLTASFVWAFRDTPDATLILKATHSDVLQTVLPVIDHVRKFGRFQCRILIIHGMLSDEAYRGLISATSYTVNTSDGEGQCLPLMEYMAAGRPAVAPRHTAMLEYVSEDNSFVVASDAKPSFWPHDDRQAMRCMKQSISFASLVNALRESHRVACAEPDRYARMSAAASAAIAAFCSDDVVTKRLTEVFDHLGVGRRAGAKPAVAAAAPREDVDRPVVEERVDSFALGLKDRELNGWLNYATSELAPGFHVSAEDVVLDLGCGEGGWAAFCGRVGAHVILADIDPAKVSEAAEFLATTPARKVDTLISDCAPIGLPDNTCSRVVCAEVLEHVDDPVAVLAEMVRVGRPGALYLITVPGGEMETILKPLAAPEYFQKPNHIRIFEGDALAEMVTAAGLKVEHRLADGFFWSLWQIFFWQTAIPLDRGSHPSLDAWAKTWIQVIDGRDGKIIKSLLDNFLPKTRAVIARKI